MRVTDEWESKPSWRDAPEWAQWLAMDAEGKWFWYESKPYLDSYSVEKEEQGEYELWDSLDRWSFACTEYFEEYRYRIEDGWMDTLEERPAA